MKISIVIFFGLLLSMPILAETNANLRISGVVHSLSSTTIKKFLIGPAHTQWLIEHFRNSHNAFNEKIEIEGEGHEGLKSKIIAVKDEGKFIRHEILLDLVAYDRTPGKPVVLKFSAN